MAGVRLNARQWYSGTFTPALSQRERESLPLQQGRLKSELDLHAELVEQVSRIHDVPRQTQLLRVDAHRQSH